MSNSAISVLHPDTVFHGRYRVIRCIKAGGMGAVYEVADEKTNKRRALKVMLANALEDPDFRRRFEDEAKITGIVESDHIVHVSDTGIDEATGTPFIVMDLLRGQELAAVVRERGAVPPAEVITYLHQTALALDKTHAARIVHRDLKPENLFVTMRDDGSPSVKILDFGIAKVVSQTADASSTRALGTPLYMAPEQIRGAKTVGPRTDIYALAQITYTLLVGEAYWAVEKEDNDSLFMVLGKIVAGAEEAPVARALRRKGVVLAPGFDAWFAKATAVEPGERFDRATAAIVALAETLGVPGPRASLASVSDVGAPPVPVSPSGAVPGMSVPSGSLGSRSGAASSSGADSQGSGSSLQPHPTGPSGIAPLEPMGSGSTTGGIASMPAAPAPAPRRSRGALILGAGVAVIALGIFLTLRILPSSSDSGATPGTPVTSVREMPSAPLVVPSGPTTGPSATVTAGPTAAISATATSSSSAQSTTTPKPPVQPPPGTGTVPKNSTSSTTTAPPVKKDPPAPTTAAPNPWSTIP